MRPGSGEPGGGRGHSAQEAQKHPGNILCPVAQKRIPATAPPPVLRETEGPTGTFFGGEKSCISHTAPAVTWHGTPGTSAAQHGSAPGRHAGYVTHSARLGTVTARHPTASGLSALKVRAMQPSMTHDLGNPWVPPSPSTLAW